MPYRPCRHLHTDGRQCGSPALTGEPFCFHHHTARKPMPERPHHDQLLTPQLPAPDDFLAIQRSIGEVLRLLANDRLTDRRAQVLLNGFAKASSNLARHHRHQARLAAQPNAASEPVTAYTNHPTHGTIALEPEQPAPDQPAPEQPPAPEPLPDPIPVLTPDPNAYTTYDQRKVIEIRASFAEVFARYREQFIEEKSAQLEDLFEERLAELDARYNQRQADLDAQHAPSIHPNPIPDTPIPTQQNEDLTIYPHQIIHQPQLQLTA